MKNKILLLNYLKNKTLKDKKNMDNLYRLSDNYIVFGKKIFSHIYKGRILNNKLFGIELIIRNKDER